MTTTTTLYAYDVRPFQIAPRDQGQIVEISYAWTEGGDMIRRVVDRSDHSVETTLLDLDADVVDDIDVVNGSVPGERHILRERPCVIVDGARLGVDD